MKLYERFLEYESDPETLIRWGAYLFIIAGILNSINNNLFAFTSILDISVLFNLLDTKADLVQAIFILNLYNALIPILFTILFGIGALSFLNIAFREDQLIWLRMVALIAVIVLLFGSFLF